MSLLAHQGGWDELLWFAVPVIAVLGIVRWAEKRSQERPTEPAERTTTISDDLDR